MTSLVVTVRILLVNNDGIGIKVQLLLLIVIRYFVAHKTLCRTPSKKQTHKFTKRHVHLFVCCVLDGV